MPPLEIPETPAIALENVQNLDEERHDKSTQTVDGGLRVAGDGTLEVDRTSSFVRDRP